LVDGTFLVIKAVSCPFTVLVVEQLVDLFTTHWLIFHTQVGAEEVNPILGVVNGENGEVWLVGIKVSAAILVGFMVWLSCAEHNVSRLIWFGWNMLAYLYGLLVLWSLYLIVCVSTNSTPFLIGE